MNARTPSGPIVVPVDFEEGAEDRILGEALRWAQAFDQEVLALHVWEPPRLLAGDTLYAVPGFDAASLSELALAEAERHMESLVTKWSTPGRRLRTRLEVGRTATVITEVAEEEGAAFIVMGTHGRRGLSRALLGSVAHGVITRSRVPVLTIPMRDEKGQD